MSDYGSTNTEARPVSDEGLPHFTTVLAVCAHPDDESFGLGAVLAALTRGGTGCGVLCFTRGEASTLGATAGDDLGLVRAVELAEAATVLSVSQTKLLDYPDGALTEIPLEELADHVQRQARISGAEALLVFDEGGITGHPDHRHATAAALAAAERDNLPVIAWAIPRTVAQTLNDELGTGFVGRTPEEIDLVVEIDRARQLDAIACHVSQSTDNPVLRRRLELLGDSEHLRYLRQGPAVPRPADGQDMETPLCEGCPESEPVTAVR